MKINLGEFSIESIVESKWPPGICVFNILTKNGSSFQCYMDERDNTFKPHYLSPSDDIIDAGEYLMKSYYTLKKTDFRFGKIDHHGEISIEPTKILTSGEFLSYLQTEHRDKNINNIIK